MPPLTYRFGHRVDVMTVRGDQTPVTRIEGVVMRLWIDDLREDPDTKSADYSDPVGWTWAKSSSEAIEWLKVSSLFVAAGLHTFEEVAFDHDLGGDDTTRPVMLWMIENDVWPQHISVHTANPVGREWLVGMARRYAPEGTSVS